MTVYVIQCQQTYNVKIGYTSRLVQSRLAELRTAASTPIELVKWYPRYSEQDEKQLHETFAKYRVTGEWFKSDVLTLIDHEIEAMGLIGERDYEAIAPNGATMSPNLMTVNVPVLKIGTQNMKQSFFEQLPEEIGFTCNGKSEVLWESSIPQDFTGYVWTGNWHGNYQIFKIIEPQQIELDGKTINGFLVSCLNEKMLFVPKGSIKGKCDPRIKADIVLFPGRLWGVIDIPIKHYGNVKGSKRYWLFENNGQLVRRTFEEIHDYKKVAPNYAEILSLLNNAQQLFLI